MTLKKIYFFDNPNSQYGVLNHFTKDLCNALNRQGVEARIIHANRQDPGGFLEQLIKDPPDCTLAFNGLFPDNQGRFLSDLIQIPHLAYLVDAPHYFFDIAKSPYNILACVDQDFCSTWQSYRVQNTLFLPHATSSDLKPLDQPEWLYDIVMLNSFIDHEAIRKAWPSKYGKEVAKLLEEAAERTLTETETSYMQAFVQTLDGYLKQGKELDPKKLDFVNLLSDLEAYIGGKSQIELLEALEGIPVHIFGTYQDSNWKTVLGPKGKRLELHSEVSFLESLEIMKRSKIVLHATLKMKQGLHERVLNGLACGAAILAHETPFLKQSFQDEKEILLYAPRDWNEVRRKINVYLDDEKKRQSLVKNGRNKVMQEHTWDQRAKTLKQELPAILKRIKPTISPNLYTQMH